MDSHSGDDTFDDSHTRADLDSADPFRRAKATLQLGRHAGTRALDQLLALLNDSEWRVVEAALKALRRYRDPRIVPTVQTVTRRKGSFLGFTSTIAISHAAARALRSQGEAGFQALLTLLREFKEDELWGQAVERQLGVLRDPRAIEPLIASFDSPVYEVAYSASRALRHFGTAIPPLIEALSITDQSAYYHVSMALRWIGAPAVPALLDALRHAADGNIRSGAADVLDRIDSEDVREALHAALDDENADVRRMAMWSLGELGDPRVLNQLLVEQPNPRPGSSEPARTIANIGSAAVPLLIAALEDQARPAYQRVHAAHALGKIKDERDVGPLIAALRDDEESIRVAAISALGDLKYAETVKPLLAALAVEPLLAASHDPSPAVRRGAVGELAAIDDERAYDEVARYIRESGEGEEGYRSTSGIIRTLALHHGERALPLLREWALDNDPWRWLMATIALSQLGAPGASVLLEMARDPQPERRHLAIMWLKHAYRHSPDPRIVDFLFEAIQENSASGVSGQTPYQVALALAECGDPRAVGPLLEILQNAARHLMMRSSMVWWLGELGDERTLEALTAIFEESKTWEGGVEDGESPGRGFDFDGFQEALLSAMEKI
ncbi:MAG TPA: HEAT repeat domain-containing protein, partial [Ktedonobacterales bacterium]